MQSSSYLLSSIKTLTTEGKNDKLGLGDGIGIITDPWTHFALKLSALIHDVDHAGVPYQRTVCNCRCLQGQECRWAKFNWASLESTDWSSPSYLLQILPTRNWILWEETEQRKPWLQEKRTRITLILQAQRLLTSWELWCRLLVSLIFPIYKKWNQKLYREMYTAFHSGRAENDPTDSWYKVISDSLTFI